MPSTTSRAGRCQIVQRDAKAPVPLRLCFAPTGAAERCGAGSGSAQRSAPATPAISPTGRRRRPSVNDLIMPRGSLRVGYARRLTTGPDRGEASRSPRVGPCMRRCARGTAQRGHTSGSPSYPFLPGCPSAGARHGQPLGRDQAPRALRPPDRFHGKGRRHPLRTVRRGERIGTLVASIAADGAPE